MRMVRQQSSITYRHRVVNDDNNLNLPGVSSVYLRAMDRAMWTHFKRRCTVAVETNESSLICFSITVVTDSVGGHTQRLGIDAITSTSYTET